MGHGQSQRKVVWLPLLLHLSIRHLDVLAAPPKTNNILAQVDSVDQALRSQLMIPTDGISLSVTPYEQWTYP